MVHTMLDLVPLPAPSRCGGKSKEYHRPVKSFLIDRDTAQQGQTSMEVTPAQQVEYDNSSVGASLPFLITMALYLCFRFVRKFRRSQSVKES
ncbi:MAG: hypothetical protein IKT00_03920 [Prevotella sp.]|nr:hypothetical protein [Prevotella sp.]